MKKVTSKTQIVGDDLYVTNLERLKVGFLNVSANSILIKLNQIGTVTETLEVIKFAQFSNSLLLPILAILLFWLINNKNIFKNSYSYKLQNILVIVIILITIILGAKGVMGLI